MSSVKETLTKDFGLVLDSTLALQLRSRGVDLDPVTIYLLEKNKARSSGEVIIERLRCSSLLEENDPVNKLVFLEGMVEKGLSLRKPQQVLGHRYDSKGLTESVARQMDMRPQTLRQVIRMMRAVFAFEEAVYPQTTPMFRESAEAFFTAYTDPDLNTPSQIKPKIEKFDSVWDGTIASFYRNMYRILSMTEIACFFAHELDFFEKRLRLQRDSRELAFFDRRVLTSYMHNGLVRAESANLKEDTGVPVDEHSITALRKILLYGLP